MGRRHQRQPQEQQDLQAQQQPRNQGLRNRLEELAYGPWDDETQQRTGPGTYLRLFDVIERGAGLNLVGGTRGAGGIPVPLRLEVLDAIADIALTIVNIERIQRRADGFMPASQKRSDRARASWGLEPLDDLAGGHTPDERVLAAIVWLIHSVDAIEAGPGAWQRSEDELAARRWRGQEPAGWHAHVDAEIARLCRAARVLCGLAKAKVKGAACPYCQLDSIYLDPFDAEVALCINPLCVDDHGNNIEFRGWAAWTAIDPAAQAAT